MTIQSQRLLGVSILLVEDDDDNREILATFLRHAGATVTTTAAAQEAFEIFKADRPSFIVTDIAMPQRDGIWLLEAVRAMPGPPVHVIAVTAHAMGGQRDRIQAARFEAYLVKPLEPEDLIVIIEQLKP